MKILITGGAGFIGTQLARALLRSGDRVSVLDNFSPQIHGDNNTLPSDLAAHVRLIRGDVRDLSAWETALPGQQCVVHLAAETGTGQSMYEVKQYEEVNLAGTANLYQLLAKRVGMSVERVVVASSRAIYGEGAYECADHGLVFPASQSAEKKRAGLFDPVCPICGSGCDSVPTPESAPFQPSSFYGLTKQVQEQMTLLFGGVLGIPSVALRYQNVYGPGQSLTNPYTGILAIFSNLARTGADINIFEDGLESRDFVYIDDVVRATALCAVGSMVGQHSINVGSNERTSVLEVATLVNRYFGEKSRLRITGSFRDGDIRHGMADLTRASELIQYEPQTSFEHGLNKFLQWASLSSPELAGYERSLSELRDRGLFHA
jgi:dTDP-L-rhamnose 4-epimerase